MSTPEFNILERIRSGPAGDDPLAQALRNRTQTQETKVEEANQQSEGGFFSQLIEGAAVGALEPLGFLPPVSRFLEAHMAPEEGHVGQKIGYALGWFGGMALPTAGALRASAATLKGLQLIRTADAVADLGFKGNLLRGAIAGGLMGAGRDAEDAGDRLKNIATEATFFGLGDAVMHPLLRAISGGSAAGETKNLDALVDIAANGVVDDVDGAMVMARAQRVLELLIPEDQALTNVELGTRKNAARLGLERLQLPQLATNEIRIVPSMSVQATDIGNVLKQLPELDFKVIARKTRKKLDIVDVLVAPAGSLDERLVRQYEENINKFGVGFFDGQFVRWKGVDRIVMGATKDGKLWTYKPGTGVKPGGRAGMAAIPIEEAVFLPHGNWRSGTENVPNAAKLWVNFVKENGEFPDNVEAAFNNLVRREGLDGAAAQDLREYFRARTYESLAKIDKPVSDILQKLRAVRPQAHPDGALAELGAQTGYVVGHGVRSEAIDYGSSNVLMTIESAADLPRVPKKGVEGFEVPFESFVAADDDFRTGAGKLVATKSQTNKDEWILGIIQPGETAITELERGHTRGSALRTIRGMMEDEDIMTGVGKISVLGANPLNELTQPYTYLKDVRTGNRTWFTTDDAAVAYMKENPLPAPDLSDVPSPLFKDFGIASVSSMPDHTAAELTINDAKIPSLMLTMGQSLLPRAAWLRMINDTLADQGIKADIFPVWSRLQQSILRGREQRQPWLERLQGLRTKGIRSESLPLMRDALMMPSEMDGKLAAKLSDVELESVQGLRQYMRDLIGDINRVDHLDLDPDEFLQEYLPFIVKHPPETWQEALTKSFTIRGKRINSRLLRFTEEMERAGINPGRHENNPFMVALRWTTTAFTKRHVDSSFLAARDLIESLPREGVSGVIRRSLEDSVKVAYSGTPEAYYVARVAADGYFKNLGINLESKDFDRIVATLISMNYGAYMAFRPALAVRNLTQLMVTTLPMIQSPKHMAYGLKVGFSKLGREEAIKALAIPANSLAAPFEDAITREAMYNALARTADGKPAQAALQVLEKGQALSHIGLGGEVKIGERRLVTGLYGKADEVNRAVSYHAQRSKTLEALTNWKGEAGHNNIMRFNEEAGLDMFGPTITSEFHRKMSNEGTEEAVRWLSVQMANETQWIYQMGAGPALFSQSWGRMIGMFGTWPSWYASHLIRGATRGSPRDRARFWAWSAATIASFPVATYATGLNFAKWTPLSSLSWTGGPIVDWFSDWRDIASGANAPGEPPTAKRALALGERGIRDTGDRVPIPVLGHLDPRKGKGLDVEEPWKIPRDLLYLFTPGAGQMRDILRAREEPTAGRALLRASGFDPVAGHSWPQIQVR